jgi:hypothetical protein
VRIASGEIPATPARLKAIDRALALAGLGTARQVDVHVETREDGTAAQVASLTDDQLAVINEILTGEAVG